MKKYDVIVIGTGAGNILTDAALDSGLKVAQIEKDKFGGTCLTKGCIPTKVMVTAADMIRNNEEVHKIGVESQPMKVNWKVLSRRVWQKIDESKEIVEEYKQEKNLDVYEGRAFFVRDKVLQVEYNQGGFSEEITADIIVLAAGARSRRIKLQGMETTSYLTSEDIFGASWPQKPYKSLIIVGAGAIGTEFAHAFSSFGTKVTVVQFEDRLLPKMDKDISKYLGERFADLGIKVHYNQISKKITQKDGEKVLQIEDKITGEIKELKAEEILVAAGVVPNTDLLELSNTSIQMNEQGWIRTNEFLETSVEGVYAIGDINGHGQLRHKANYEADILVHNLFPEALPPGQVAEGMKPERRFARFEYIPSVTYTYPQVSSIGLSEEEARKQASEKGWDIRVGYHHYSSTAKGYAMGFEPGDKEDGFIKVIIDAKSKYILGVHIIGAEAGILLQPYASLLGSGRIEHVVYEQEIGSEETKKARATDYSRYLDPHKVTSITEAMTAHPALTELVMWTQYFVPMK